MLPSRTWSRQTGHRAEPNGLLGRTAWDSHSAMRLVGVPCPSRLTGPIWSRSCSARTRRTGRWDGLGPYLIPTAIIAHSKGGVNAESVRGVSAAAGGLSSGERQRGRRISVRKERCDIVWETHIGLGAGEEMSPRPDQSAEQMFSTGAHAETPSSVSACAPHDSSRHHLRLAVPSRFTFCSRGRDSLETEAHSLGCEWRRACLLTAITSVLGRQCPPAVGSLWTAMLSWC